MNDNKYYELYDESLEIIPGSDTTTNRLPERGDVISFNGECYEVVRHHYPTNDGCSYACPVVRKLTDNNDA